MEEVADVIEKKLVKYHSIHGKYPDLIILPQDMKAKYGRQDLVRGELLYYKGIEVLYSITRDKIGFVSDIYE